MNSNKFTQSPAEKKTATGLTQSIVSSFRQRLATPDAHLSNSVSTSSTGLRNFWRTNDIRNLAAVGFGTLSSTPPTATPSSGVKIHQSFTQIDPNIVSPDNGVNSLPSALVTSPSIGSPESAARPRTLTGTILSEHPTSSSNLQDDLPDVVTSTSTSVKASVEHGRTATTPTSTSAGLAGNIATAPVDSSPVEVGSPLFALDPSVADPSPSPLEMNDADFSVLTSPEPDLHAQSYADGYHHSSFVSTVTSEDKDDIGLLRAIEESGGESLRAIDPHQEKEMIRNQKAALEAYRAAQDELRAAFNTPPNFVDSPSPVVETAVSNVPLPTVEQSSVSVASAVTDDVNKLVTALLQQNSALAAELSTLKAAPLDSKVSPKVVTTTAVDGDDDDEVVVEEFSGSNEYDMKDPWIVASQASALRSGEDSTTQVGEITSAPPRLVPGDHGSDSLEGWSGLDPATWMGNVTTTGASLQNHTQRSDEYSWIPVQDFGREQCPMPSNGFHAGPPPPSSPPGPRPPAVSSHTQRVDDVLLDQFVADDAVPPDEPRAEYADNADLEVIVPKSERLRAGAYGHGEQMKYLTKPMPTEFGVLPANVTEKTDKGNISPSMSIVERFDTQLGTVKKSAEHLHARDLVGIIYVPRKLSGVDAHMPTSTLRASTRHNLFVGGGSVRLSILHSWSDIDFEDVVLWQRMVSLSHRSLTAYERGSDQILFSMVKKSCTSDFWEDLLRQRDDSGLDEESWGGISALYLSITTLFYAPEHILVALRQDFKDFEKVGLTKTEGENVKVVAKHLGRVNLALRQGNGLQSELVGQVIKGFTVASCPAFKDHFTKLAHEETMIFHAAYRNRTKVVDATQHQIYDKIKFVLGNATDYHEALTTQRKWLDLRGKDLSFMNVRTKPGIPRTIKAGMSCDNCLSTEHLSPDCPEEKNPKVMRENRARRQAAEKEEKEKSNNKSKDLPVRDKSGNASRRGSPPSTAHHQREPRVNLATGKVEMFCGICGCFGNHSKKYHKQAQKPGFNLADVSPNHPLVKAQAAIDRATSSAPAPAASTPAPAATVPASARTVTAAQFSNFTARQSQLVEEITRHGSDSTLGIEAKSQLDQLQKDWEAHFR